MKYFKINTNEFLRTRNTGYYFAALRYVEDYIEEDQEPEFLNRLDLDLHIIDVTDRLMLEQNKSLVTEWFNCMFTFYVGRL